MVATIMPPTMPVMMPVVGGKPDAIEMPIHNGRATRKTTIEARKSRPNVLVAGAETPFDVVMSVPRPGAEHPPRGVIFIFAEDRFSACTLNGGDDSHSETAPQRPRDSKKMRQCDTNQKKRG